MVGESERDLERERVMQEVSVYGQRVTVEAYVSHNHYTVINASGAAISD